MMLCDTCFHANTCVNFCVGEGAYETTGCQYYDNAVHICDLLTAEKDGRLVVLPCKVETIMERYNALKFPTGDEAETYSTGYRNGHKNGQAELLEYLLGIDTGERNEAAEAALGAQK